jgi:hypothetical protein
MSPPAPEGGTFARRVLWTLPQAHQSFLFHVQPPEFPDIETDPDEGRLGPADAVNISRGVLITAERTFQPDDDVWEPLRMLAKVPGVLDGSDGSRWPVGRLVTILNAEFSPPSWSDDGSRTQKNVC